MEGEEVTFTITFKYKEAKESYENTTLDSLLNFKFKVPGAVSSEGDLQIDIVRSGECWGSYTCQYSATITNLNEEYNLKDWQGVYALEGASSCTVDQMWDSTVTIVGDTLVIKADTPVKNVISFERTENKNKLTSAGFQLTCPQENVLENPTLSYVLVTDGDGEGETGEGGESGGTSEDTTTTTKENLTVNFKRDNFWTSGTGYQAAYNVTVSNKTDTNFTDWSFKITMPEGMTISSFYTCTIEQEGNVATITPVADWQKAIASGGSLEFGITFQTDDLNKMIKIS